MSSKLGGATHVNNYPQDTEAVTSAAYRSTVTSTDPCPSHVVVLPNLIPSSSILQVSEHSWKNRTDKISN